MWRIDWAYAQTVTGSFTVTGPGDYSQRSGTDTWTTTIGSAPTAPTASPSTAPTARATT